MFWPLAIVLLATAAFCVAVVRMRTRRVGDDRAGAGRALELEQVQGFVYVGAAALSLLGVVVMVFGGPLARPGPAEAMAVIGLMAFLLYLTVAVVVIARSARRRRKRPEHCD